ncbi:MAG: tRNA lysidine(34) synthetase TilS [Anaerolineales bacterium]|nr:tRNA lysidine(34) synthetase TilS [Anaerolineales bacterium]MDW8161802.1 tRNA lysidine(34) synthetase TilS [Anaerolineales bacterium]
MAPHDELVVGVSGGPDSLALMVSLYEAGWRMMVAHLNHQLRPAAHVEEEGVREIASRLGVPFVSRRVDVIAYARENSMSIEEAARHCRYRFLFEEAHRIQAKAVLVAHTADDQVETFLMRLLRGAGGEGLRGMRVSLLPNPWSATIPLIRPLLSVWRAQIMDYLAQRELQPFWDESNLDNAYLRNRIRNSLLPQLESYNPQIRKLLWQTSCILADEEEVLDAQLELAWREIVVEHPAKVLGLNLAKFGRVPRPIQRRVIRRAWQFVVGSLADLEFTWVEELIDVLLAEGVLRRQVGGRLLCLKDRDQGYFLKLGASLPSLGYPQLESDEVLVVPLSGRVTLGENWLVQVEVVEGQPYLAMKQRQVQPYEAWIDFEACKGGVFIRPPRPGDRFRPLSMHGQQTKLSDVFINRKVPFWLRKAYPLVCSESEILWVPGYTIAHSAQLRPDTRKALHITLLPSG